MSLESPNGDPGRGESARGESARSDSEEIFLSPRVIDENSFSSFADRLRMIIDEAKGITGDADEAARGAAKLRNALSQCSTDLENRLTGAERLLAQLDRQRVQAEEMYEKAASRAGSIAELEEVAERIASRKQAELEKSINTAVEAAEQRVRQVDLRIEQLAKNAEARADVLTARLDQVVEEAESRLESVLDRFQGAVDESAIDARIEQLTGACKSADELLKKDGSNTSLPSLLTRAIETTDRLKAAAADADRTSSGAEARAESLRRTIVEADEKTQSEDARVARIEALLAEIESKADAADQRLAERIAETEKAAADPIAHLRRLSDEIRSDAEKLTANASEAREQVQEASDWNTALLMRIEQATARLEPWRDVLLSGEAPEELPKPLADIITRAHRELSRPLMELGSIIQTIGQRAQNESAARPGQRQTVVVAGKTDKSKSASS